MEVVYDSISTRAQFILLVEEQRPSQWSAAAHIPAKRKTPLEKLPSFYARVIALCYLLLLHTCN